MSRPTCCCSESLDRCDRCDLLVGLDGFHLMSVARTPDALMLDIVSSPGFCVEFFRPLSFVLLCVCFLLVAV